MAEAKMYTKEEIDGLTDAKLEEFAANLDWKNPGRYSYRTNLQRYKSAGFPTTYAQRVVGSRREFLIMRLKASAQAKWNSDAKALIAAEKAKKEAEQKKKEAEAQKNWNKTPKVGVEVESNVKVTLKDCRWKGHTFLLRSEGDRVIIGQKQRTGATVGQTICTTEGSYDRQQILDALDLLSTTNMPKTETIKKGKAEIKVSATLTIGGKDAKRSYDRYPIDLALGADGVVKTRQQDDYGNRGWSWHFKIADFREALLALDKKYKVVEVKEERKAA